MPTPAAVAPRRGRGRPKGAANRTVTEAQTRQGRGRPPIEGGYQRVSVSMDTDNFTWLKIVAGKKKTNLSRLVNALVKRFRQAAKPA